MLNKVSAAAERKPPHRRWIHSIEELVDRENQHLTEGWDTKTINQIKLMKSPRVAG